MQKQWLIGACVAAAKATPLAAQNTAENQKDWLNAPPATPPSTPEAP